MSFPVRLELEGEQGKPRLSTRLQNHRRTPHIPFQSSQEAYPSRRILWK
jgi:hypothetical protein